VRSGSDCEVGYAIASGAHQTARKRPQDVAIVAKGSCDGKFVSSKSCVGSILSNGNAILVGQPRVLTIKHIKTLTTDIILLFMCRPRISYALFTIEGLL
jgi:hypothetical protein